MKENPMKEKHWILESAILITLGTGVLFSLGHYYDFRMRFEFGIPTIPLGISAETLIHDGVTILIVWFGSTKEFWIALSLLIPMAAGFVLLRKKYHRPNKIGLNALLVFLGLAVFYVSVIHYIPSRASAIAESIKRHAALQRQTIILRDHVSIEGYTIIGTPSKIAFLRSDNKVFIVQYSDIQRIVAAHSGMENQLQ